VKFGRFVTSGRQSKVWASGGQEYPAQAAAEAVREKKAKAAEAEIKG
jgi:hypothetical protein